MKVKILGLSFPVYSGNNSEVIRCHVYREIMPSYLEIYRDVCVCACVCVCVWACTRKSRCVCMCVCACMCLVLSVFVCAGFSAFLSVCGRGGCVRV
jgi:hypothetical protein